MDEGPAETMSARFGKLRDDLDLKIEACQPVHANRSPGGKRLFGEDLVLHAHDIVKLCFRVGVETRQVDNVIKGAARSLEDVFEIAEGLLDLSAKFRFG